MRAFVWACLVGLIGCGWTGSTRPDPIEAGSDAPSFWVAEPEQVVVGWTLTEGDLLRCETEADELRRLQRHLGPRMKLTVVAVGADSNRVASFFRTERLSADLVALDEKEFRRRFGPALLPSLYVVRNGKITDVIRPLSIVDSLPQGTWLEQPVQRALQD